MAINNHIAHRKPGDDRSRWADPQRLVNDLNGVWQIRYVCDGQLPVTEGRDFGRDPFLHDRIPP